MVAMTSRRIRQRSICAACALVLLVVGVACGSRVDVTETSDLADPQVVTSVPLDGAPLSTTTTSLDVGISTTTSSSALDPPTTPLPTDVTSSSAPVDPSTVPGQIGGQVRSTENFCAAAQKLDIRDVNSFAVFSPGGAAQVVSNFGRMQETAPQELIEPLGEMRDLIVEGESKITSGEIKTADQFKTWLSTTDLAKLRLWAEGQQATAAFINSNCHF